MPAPILSLYPGKSGNQEGRGYRKPGTGRDGVPPVTLPSVTTILKHADKSGLTQWAIGLTLDAVNKNPDMVYQRSDQDMKRHFQYQWHKVRDERAEVGTGIHETIEAIHTGSDRYPFLDDEQMRIMQRWEDFNFHHRVEPVHTEFTVWNEEVRYAGTADGLWYIDGKLTTVDLKGLPLETRIPTPDGWSTMGEISEGDMVYGSDGKSYPVVQKSEIHYNPCYQITFDTGETVTCDADHRWAVRTSSSYQEEVLTAEQIFIRGVRGNNGRRDIRVMNPAPIEGENIALPVDPYVLGVWLGDGTASKNEITLNSTTKTEVIPELERRGWPVTVVEYPSDRESLGVRIRLGDRGRSYHASEFKTALRDLDVLNNKHIPAIYMRASFSQRLDLLRGIMDTDGGWNIARNNEVAICMTDEHMIRQIAELISTMGWRRYIYSNPISWTHNGEKKWTTAWSIKFRPCDFSPFLARDYPMVPQPANAMSRRRVITDIQPVDMVPTQCIEVASPDHTYLFGDSMIVTHNTSKNTWPEHFAQLAALRYAPYAWIQCEKDDDGALLHVDPKKRETYWKQIPNPALESESVCIVHLREDLWELIEVENIDVHWEVFKGYSLVHHSKAKLKELEKGVTLAVAELEELED